MNMPERSTGDDRQAPLQRVEARLTAGRVRLTPDPAVVEAGRTVSITVHSDLAGGTVIIPAFDVSATFSPAAPAVLTFTPNQTGDFTVWVPDARRPLFTLTVVDSALGSQRGGKSHGRDVNPH